MGLFRETLEGADGKGSSKNITAFWTVVLLTILHICFVYIGIRIVEKTVPTDASLKVMNGFRDLIAVDWTFLMILLGLASVQTIIQALRAFRGQPADPIQTETVERTSKTVTVMPPSAPTTPENVVENKE
jgi:hypothetical protein